MKQLFAKREHKSLGLLVAGVQSGKPTSFKWPVAGGLRERRVVKHGGEGRCSVDADEREVKI